MAIEQNVLRSCVALKLITNGLDMAHDMREQRRGATKHQIVLYIYFGGGVMYKLAS